MDTLINTKKGLGLHYCSNPFFPSTHTTYCRLKRTTQQLLPRLNLLSNYSLPRRLYDRETHSTRLNIRFWEASHSCWRTFADSGGPTGVSSTGGPRAACQISFVTADFRPGRACSAAGIACWGRRPGQEHDNTNSLANETTTQ